MLTRALLGAALIASVTQAAAQITLYEGEGFRGRDLTAERSIPNLDQFGFNDRASSVIVSGGWWEACEHARFEGRCVVLEPGSYNSLSRMGLGNAISSVRALSGEGLSVYRPRPDERLYQAEITSVHAVVGPPEERCWIEREQATERGANVPGAILGGLVGGVLGHQIGSGRGRDAATVGGAVAGAAIGANAGRGGTTYDREVRRCASVPDSSRIAYWDVGYFFGGRQHYVQLTEPPRGSTITVNEFGEPRA